MTHDPYGDAELVTLYDSDNPGGRDHAFYRALADELGATTVVDLGCGTGLLTRSFAAPGRTVVGVDPSATMLDFARRQPRAGGVRWILGDATALPGSGDVDLVVCTGNAIQHISTEELPTALIHIAGALRPGGIVSFESRNPSFREWERRTPQATVGERETPFGHLREWLEVTSVDDARRVVFDAQHRRRWAGPDLHQRAALSHWPTVHRPAHGRRFRPGRDRGRLGTRSSDRCVSDHGCACRSQLS